MRPSFAALAVALLLSACGDEGGSGGRSGSGESAVKKLGFAGRFTAEGANGPVTLTLAERGDVVEISMGGDKAVGKRVAENRVEAETKEGEVTGHMVFTLEGGDIRMEGYAEVPSGERMDMPSTLFRRVGQEPKKSGG